MKKAIITIVTLMFALSTSAQKKKELHVISYKTSITCEHCIETIMGSLPLEKGVKDVKCDLETKEVKVTIRVDKTDTEKIKRALEKLGYTAKKIEEKPLVKKKKIKDQAIDPMLL